MRSKNHYFMLIIQKAIADLISEARRGYLGILWWIIEPVLYMSIFYAIFVILFNRGGEDRVAFLLIGLVVWKWFATSIPQCANSIVANIGLIRQVYIPKFVFPSMILVSCTIKFLIIFVLLIGFLVITGKDLSVVWISLFVLMGVQFLVMLAIGSVCAAIVPFIPDLKLIIDNSMIFLFFLSGVFFDINMASSEMRMYLNLNPMVGIINSYREIILEGIWPNWILLATVSSISLIVLTIGWLLLRHFDRTYAKVI